MFKSNEYIYCLINKLSATIRDILDSYLDDVDKSLRAYLTCHEFAFYLLELGIKDSPVTKREFLNELLKAFSSHLQLIFGKITTSGGEYLHLLFEREFEGMRVELDTMLNLKGMTHEEALEHLLMRRGIAPTHSSTISKRVMKALRILDIPQEEDYYHSSKSFKIAVS